MGIIEIDVETYVRIIEICEGTIGIYVETIGIIYICVRIIEMYGKTIEIYVETYVRTI